MFVVRSVCADDDVSLLLWLQLLVVWPLQLSTDLLCSVAQVTGKVTLLCTHIHMKQFPLPLFASLLDHCPPLPSKSHFFPLPSLFLFLSLRLSLSLSSSFSSISFSPHQAVERQIRSWFTIQLNVVIETLLQKKKKKKKKNPSFSPPCSVISPR